MATARKMPLENKHLPNRDYLPLSHLVRILQLDWYARSEIKYRELKIYVCMLKLSPNGKCGNFTFVLQRTARTSS